jgi:hypothetical protein
MSTAAQAAATQTRTGYGVDSWSDMKLEPMTKVWAGEDDGGGRNSAFFFSEEDARYVRGSYVGTNPVHFAETLWRMAQVSPSAKYGYRNAIIEYVVDLPVAAAVGYCFSNGHLGGGGVYQYYIPDWNKCMFRTGRRYAFRHVNL